MLAIRALTPRPEPRDQRDPDGEMDPRKSGCDHIGSRQQGMRDERRIPRRTVWEPRRELFVQRLRPALSRRRPGRRSRELFRARRPRRPRPCKSAGSPVASGEWHRTRESIFMHTPRPTTAGTMVSSSPIPVTQPLIVCPLSPLSFHLRGAQRPSSRVSTSQLTNHRIARSTFSGLI